jgi:hypothetical protein
MLCARQPQAGQPQSAAGTARRRTRRGSGRPILALTTFDLDEHDFLPDRVRAVIVAYETGLVRPGAA